MVAVVSGAGLGLFGSSVSALGGIGASGNGAVGRGNDRVYVNTANGNLIVQSQDERLSALGLDLNLVRTYNSQGLLDDDNGDNWRLGVHQRLYNLIGIVNTAGSSITKVFGDGREVAYAFDVSLGSYVSTEGEGAHDTLTFASNSWTWEEGSSHVKEIYDENGRLASFKDADDNEITYHYTGSLLTRIDDASGQSTYLDYTGNNLTQIRVVSNGQTQTLTHYVYDGEDRLIQVKLDLSPEDNSIADNDVYTTTYTYDGTSRRIASITQSDGSSVAFTYRLIDGEYRVESYTDALGRVTTLTYTQPSTSGGGSSPISAPANTSVLSTTQTQSTTYNLNTSGLGGLVGWSEPTLLETELTPDAFSPHVRFDADGNGFAVWMQGNDVLVRRYTVATDSWSAAVTLDTRADAIERVLLEVDRATGKAVATWIQSDGVASSVYASAFDASTGTWSAAQLLESTSAAVEPEYLSLSVRGDYAAVMWLQADGADYSAQLAVLDHGTWDTPVAVASGLDLHRQGVQVAIDAAGNATVLWQEDPTHSDLGSTRPYANRWNSTTQSFSGALPLDAAVSGGFSPRIALDAQGNATAVWQDWYGVQARRFDAASGSWGAITEIGESNDIKMGDLAVDAAGNALLAWAQYDGSAWSLYTSSYDPNTLSWTPPVLLENSTDDIDRDSRIAVSLVGDKGVVSWVNLDTERSHYAVRLSDGSWTAPVRLDNGPRRVTDPSVAIDAAGNIAAVWTHHDGDAYSIYYSRYTNVAAPYYRIPSGATWRFLANTLYGVNSAAAGSALQAALGDPPLTAGALLTNLPATLTVTTPVTQGRNLNSGALTVSAGSWSAASLLETELTPDAFSPHVRFDADGNGFAVWMQGNDVLVRRYTVATDSWSAAVTLDTRADAIERVLLEVDRATGKAVATWIQSDGVASSVYASVFDASTATWSAAQLLESVSAAVEPENLSVSIRGDYAAVMWLQADGTDYSAQLAVLDHGTWGTPVTVASGLDLHRQGVQVAIDAAGNATVLWREDPAHSDILNFNARLYANRWNSTTQSFSGALPIDVSISGSVFQRIALDAQGNATVVWQDWHGVQARRFDAASGSWGAITQICESNDLSMGDLAVDAAGNALLAWVQHDGSAYSLYTSSYDLNTLSWTPQVLLENFTVDIDRDSRIAVSLAGGKGVVSWVNIDSERSHYAVRLSDGSWTAPVRLDNGPRRVTDPSVAIDAAGNIAAVWTHHDGDAYSIYYSRYTVPYYTIPSGATWQSLANTLYGDGSVAAANALQAALGSPLLTAGARLEGLPAVLQVPVTVPAYYTVLAGDTWASITNSIYGVTDPEAIAELQQQLGNPALTSGAKLTVPLTLSYGSLGATTVDITDPAGVVTRYEQDEKGRLIAVTTAPDTLALRTEYEYDADGNVISIIRDPDGLNRVTRMTYDDNGNQVTQRDDLGNLIERTYGSSNQLLTETVYQVRDPDGAGSGVASVPLTTRYVYDGEQHLRFTISATGRVTEHRYNTAGERQTTVTYTGALYEATASDLSSLATWAAAQNQTLLQRLDYAYDWRGNLASLTEYRSTDSSGNGVNASVMRFVYDQRGQLLQTVDARGTTTDGDDPTVPYATTYTYDGLGRVLSVHQWNDTGDVSTTLTAYDDLNRSTSVTLANGLVTTTVRNLAGDIVSILNGIATNHSSLGTTRYTYDDGGRLRFQTDPSGVRQFFEYDDAGRRVAQIDADGTLTEFVYDDLSRVIKTVVYGTRVDSTTLASLVDVNQERTNVSLATIRAAADDTPTADRITRSVYDAGGLLIYQIDATGAVTQYFYDGAGRVTDEVRYAEEVVIAASTNQVLDGSFTITASTADRRTRHFYDADGLRRGTLDAAGYLVEFIYDAGGRLVEQVGYANQTGGSYWSTGTFAQLRTSAGVDDETVVDPERDIHSYFFYDGQGRRIGVLDAEGYLTETVYDSADHITQQTRFNRALTYTPGSSTFASLRAAAVAVPAPVSHTSTFEYDGAGRLVSETNYEGTETTYTYDSVGRLIATTRAFGTTEARTTETRYDLLGRVKQELTAEGRAQITSGMTQVQIDQIWQRYGVTYEYDAAGRRVSATVRPNDSQTNVTLYYYDADGRLRFEISPLGEVKELRYDAFGQLTHTIGYHTALVSTAGLTGGLVTSALEDLVEGIADAAFDTHVTSTYTARGQVDTVSTAEGAQTTSTYTAFGELATRHQTLTNTSALDISYSYDRRGLLTQTRREPNGLNVIEQRSYDAFGRLVSVTDANGGVRETQYDRLGRAIVTIGADGAERSVAYDAFDRVMSTTDAMGAVTTYAYNDTTRSTVVTTPELIAVTTVHNRHGQTVSVTAAGNTTDYSYDLNGALTGVSDDLGTLESRTYDRAGRQVTVTDAREVTTTFTYDAANRVLTRVVDSGSGGLQYTTSYEYDGQGRVELVTDPSGTQTRTTYDRDGRVIMTAVDPDDLNIRTRYEYDFGGRVIKTTEGYDSDNPRVTTIAYDDLGRRIQEIVDEGDGINPLTGRLYLNLTTDYEYDGNGNVIRKNDPNGNYTVYVYDSESRLRYTVDAEGGATRNDYDSEGRVVQTTRYHDYLNFDKLFTSGIVITVEMIEDEWPPVFDAQQDRNEQFVYDADGREVFHIDAMGGVTRKEYDDAGNVIHRRMYSQRIDVAAYRTVQSIEDELQELADDRQSWATFNVRNRMLHSIDALGGVVAYEYDDAGNVVRKTAYATQIPTSGTLSAATVQAWAGSHSAANDQVTRTWYDAAGRTQYVLDAMNYLTEYQYDEVGRVVEQIKYFRAPSIDGNNAVMPVVTAAEDQHTVSDYDAAGRLISVTDANGVAETYDYDEVGNRTDFTNRNGAHWVYVYDANRRLIEEHSPVVAVDRVERGGLLGWGGALGPALVSLTTREESIVTLIDYDALGNVIARIEGSDTNEQRVTIYHYDALGRQTGVEYPEAEFYTADSLARGDMNESGWSWEVGEGISEWLVPYTETLYDAFGNAYANRDVAGNYSYRSFDLLGRVISETDAENYVTGYTYDTFGNQTGLTRYANRLDAGELVPDPARDRTLVSTYDTLNRLVSVTQPLAMVFDPAVGQLGGSSGMVSAVTTNSYDAFGRLTKQSQLASLGGTTADTYYYYDRRNAQVAEVDALGYVTTHAYDAVGNLTGTREYATALQAGSWNEAGFASPVEVAGQDRRTEWTYDVLNQKRIETRTVSYTKMVDGELEAKPDELQVTSFDYDAVGNQTRRTDPSGLTTYVYYDALGRQIATAAGSRDVDVGGTSLIPLTTMKYDALGNMVAQTVWGGGTTSADADGYAPPIASATDRTSRFLFNSHGKVIQTQDAGGANHFALYNERGQLAREWTPISEPDLELMHHQITVYEYDKLGRQITTIRNTFWNPDNFEIEGRHQVVYNAFGEIVGKGLDGISETFEYDQAGHLWRTNSNDGVYKIYLYNLLGQATAEFRSADGGAANSLQTSVIRFIDADEVFETPNLLRTETRYDLLGRVLEQRKPGFVPASQSQASVEAMAINFSIGQLLGPSNPDAVYRRKTWDPLYGVGMIQEFLVYDPELSAAQGGGWYYSAAGNGLAVQDPTYQLVSSRYIHWTPPQGYSADMRVPGINITFEYRAAGSTDSWDSLRVVGLRNGEVGVDTDALANGNYEYRVSYSRANIVTPYAVSIGTVAISGNTATFDDTTVESLLDVGVTPVVITSQVAINTQFRDANFTIDGFSGMSPLDGLVYRRVVAGSVVSYVPDRGATLAEGGGYYRTESGYVQKSGYTVENSLYVRWQRPADATLVPTFQVRPAGSSEEWATLTVGTVGTQFSVAIGSFADGQYEFQITYTAPGQTAPAATAKGVFEVKPVLLLADQVVVPNPSDNAGTVAAITNRPPGTSAIVSSVTSSAHINAETAGQALFIGDNTVNVRFPSINGRVRVEIEYLTAAIGAADYAGSGNGYPAVARRISLEVANASTAASGINLTWRDPTAAQNAGGISQVVNVRVYSLDSEDNATLKYATDPASATSIGGSQLSWVAPADTSIVPTFQVRRPGTTTWTTHTVTRVGGDFTTDLADLGSGAWEYQVIYQTATGVQRASAAGTVVVNAGASANFHENPGSGPYPVESVTTVNGASTAPVEFVIGNSAHQEITTPSYVIVNGQMQQHQPLGTTWEEGNQLTLTWADLGVSGPVRVEVDYTSAPRYAFNYTTSEPPHWEESAAWVPGQLTRKSFDVTSGAATGTTLTWEDDDASLLGGIQQVQRVRVYTQVGSEWVLRYDRDAAPPTGGTSLYWSAPDDSAVDAAVFVREQGQTTWVARTATLHGGQYSVDLAGLATGQYEYQIRYSVTSGSVTTPTALTSGTFAIDTAQVSNTRTQIIAVEQSNVSFDDGETGIGAVAWDGEDLSWTFAPTSGDTVVVRTRVAGTTTWSEQTVSGTGPDFTHAFTAAGSQVYEFEVSYIHSGQTVAYATTAGTLNGSVAEQREPTTVAIIQQSTATTTIAPLTELWMFNGILNWSSQSQLGTVSFRYRLLNGSWTDLTPISTSSGYSVDLRALPPGAYEYEIAYKQSSATLPHTFGSGSIVVGAAALNGGVSIENRTVYVRSVSQATSENVPTQAQTFDRWGNVTSLTDVFGNTTHYSYNQLGLLVKTELPAVDRVDTTGGTRVVTHGHTPTSYNYYDLAGRLIAIEDANGHINTVEYNTAGQILRERHADGGTKEYKYDAFGQKVEVLDEGGFRTRNAYDKKGNLTQVRQEVLAGAFDLPPSPGLVLTTSYEYDEANQRIKETNGAGETTRYRYDPMGNLWMRTSQLGATTTYLYDWLGNKIEERDANYDWSGGGYDTRLAQTWSYDYWGRVISHRDLGGATYRYAYNSLGLLELQTSSLGQNLAYEYDSAGQLITIYDNGVAKANADVVSSKKITEYAYDLAGRRVHERTVVDGLVHQDSWITYDALGRIATVTDPDFLVTYSYDAVGNRTHIEGDYFDHTGFTTGHQRTQDLWYTYDEMNRVLVSEGVISGDSIGISSTQGTELTYNEKGERETALTYGKYLSIQSTLVNILGHQIWMSAYIENDGLFTERYTYDGLGRLTNTHMLAPTVITDPYAGTIENTNTWVETNQKSYDGASRVTSDTSWLLGGGASLDVITTTTTYDDDGRPMLQATIKNGRMQSRILYESTAEWVTGRYTTPGSYLRDYLQSQGGGTLLSLSSSSSQSSTSSRGTQALSRYEGPPPAPFSWRYNPTRYAPATSIWVPGHFTGEGFDAAGNLHSYKVEVYRDDGKYLYTTEHKLKYRLGDSYQQTEERTKSTTTVHNIARPGDGHTIRTYNVNGELVAYVDERDTNKNRFFVNNAQGQALTVVKGNFDGKDGHLTVQAAFDNAVRRVGYDVKAQHFFSAAGQTIGSFGQLTDKDNQFTANFDINYTPVSESYPSRAPGQYIVQSGDTLRSVAARLFGDSGLWYLIAEENGLTDPDAALEAGLALRITNDVVTLSNAAGSFKPFDVSEAIGNTTPTQPPIMPKKKSWGILQIFIVIVAVIVSAYIGPWFSNYLGPYLGSAATAAVASAASQGIAIAAGAQDSFNWKAVGAAALSGFAGEVMSTAGLGQVGTAAANSAINQGVNIAFGVQEQFNWAAVAASAVAAPVASRIGEKAGQGVQSATGNADLGRFASRFTQGMVNQVSYAAFTGGKLNYAQMAADSFGNALGNAIADHLEPLPVPFKMDWDEVSSQVEAGYLASQGQFNDQLQRDMRQQQRDVRQQQFQASLQRDIERSLSNNPEFVADLPMPRGEFDAPIAPPRPDPYLATARAQIGDFWKDGVREASYSGVDQQFSDAFDELLVRPAAAPPRAVPGQQMSDALYLAGPIPIARYDLGMASLTVNGGLNFFNGVANAGLNVLGVLTEPLDRYQGELISMETGVGPAGMVALGPTLLAGRLSAAIRAKTALNATLLRGTSRDVSLSRLFEIPEGLNPLSAQKVDLWRGYLERRGVKFEIGTDRAYSVLKEEGALGVFERTLVNSETNSFNRTIYLRKDFNASEFYEEAFHALDDLHGVPGTQVRNGVDIDFRELRAKELMLRAQFNRVNNGRAPLLTYEEVIKLERDLDLVRRGEY